MSARRRLSATAIALVLIPLATAPLALGAATNQKPPVKRPKDGSQFDGQHPKTSLIISGKSIQIYALRFPCRKVKGNTSLQDISLRKTPKGYRFDIAAHSIVTYSDNDKHPDENAAITLSGLFSRNAKKVTGHVRVKAPRCDTGKIAWGAARVPAAR
jgi:hypothetical protein